ncbi:MAG: hypothetical protein D6725_09380 [Planctomycetota bacterium]|nr:MAG: hypothetical protein D6725_09380 [Planctomycetota bacterium]
MKTTVPIDPTGKDQATWTNVIRDLAVGRTLRAAPLANSPNAAHWLADFTRGNLLKRIDKLHDQLDLPANPFADLEHLLERYVREIPLRAFDIGTTDAARFARWLWRHFELTPHQRDALRVVRCRCAVEALARHQRLVYLRFHERHQWNLSAGIGWDLAVREGMKLMVNPVRIWSTFETRWLLDEDADVVARPVRRRTGEPTSPLSLPRGRYGVVFYAIAGEIGSVELAGEVRPVLNVLSGPPLRSVAEWTDRLAVSGNGLAAAPIEPADFAELIQVGVACGLFAFA